MESSNRIVRAEGVLHEMARRLSTVPSSRGHGFDVVDIGDRKDKWKEPAVKWWPSADEAAAWVQFRTAEAMVSVLDAYPPSVEEFAARFEDEYFQNYETDEASDEGKQLAKAILKPFVKWFEDGADKRKSTPSGMTLAMARMFGFLTYTVNAATVARETGARLEKLRELLIDIGRAATSYQGEDDREAMVVVDMITGEVEGVEGQAPQQSIELTAEDIHQAGFVLGDDTPTKGNA